MFKKIFLVFLFFFIVFSKPTFSQSNDKARISVSSHDSYSKGILEYASTENVKINVSSHLTSGQGQITIYEANLNDVFKYITYDKDRKQINPEIDFNNRKIISSLNNINFVADKETGVDLLLADSGIWIVQAKLGELTDSTFVIRNTFGAISKESKDNIIVWAQNFSNKRIIKNGTAKLYNFNNSPKLIGQANLDNDSIASLPLTIDADIAIIESNGESAIIPLNAKFLNSYFWFNYSPNILKRNYFSFTDRPIYKPGDKVNFKAIIRDEDDARYSISSGSVLVEASFGYGDSKLVVYNQILSIDDKGNINGQFKLDENAPVGGYSLTFKNPNSVDKNIYETSLYFQVENYRKPEYFLTSNTKINDVVRGDKLNIDVNAQLFSGQPLPNVSVHYKVYRDYSYEYQYYYPQESNSYRAWWGEVIKEGDLTLNKKGQGKLELPTNETDSKGQNQVFSVEFTYHDTTGNTATSANNFYIRSGEHSLYRSSDSYSQVKIDQEYSIPLTLKNNVKNSSLKKDISIKTKRDWWEKIEDPSKKYPSYEKKTEDLENFKIKTDASGNSVITFTPKKSGSYIFTTEIEDSQGNLINKDFSVWVNDNDNWYDNSPQQNSSITVTSDKDSYLPGETARFQITSSIPDRDVLFSVERGYMDRYQLVHMQGNKAVIDLPLFDHDMPNIFATVSSFGSDNLDSDIKNIIVSPQKKKLNITLKTDKEKYGPGDEVTVDVTTTDLSGNPISANIALWAVDKAIFELSDKNYGDIFKNFWSEKYNDTTSNNSLQGILVNSGAEKGGCFLPETLISLANGSTKKISEIKVGDKIITRKSDTSSKLVTALVKKVLVAKEDAYLIINGTLRLTADHLIFLNGGWHTAGSAQVGDILVDKNAKTVKISSVEWITGTTDVYNLSLDRYFTFFADGIWVHNEKGGGTRDNFNDTAYWNPSIDTASNGQAQIRFKLPDNLTTWQIAVLGSSLDTKLGEAYSDIKVKKDLVIRPVLPNILRQGDLVTLSAIVHNFTDSDKNVKATFMAPDLDLKSDPSQTIKLAANSFQEIYWQVETSKVKSVASLTYSVEETNGLSDTVLQKIDILSQGYLDKSYQSAKGNSSFNLDLPEKTDPNLSFVNLKLSTSLLGSLTSSMKYLIDYPYGCTEQTISRLVPIILAKSNPSLFATALSGKDTNKMLITGLNRLRELQNSDGGWSWWYGESNPFVTAYVSKNLSALQSINVDVPIDILTKAKEYLIRISKEDTFDYYKQISAAYGLSYLSKSDAKIISPDLLTSLPDDYLAMAVIANIRLGNNDSTSNGLDKLISRYQTEGQTIYWGSAAIDRFGSADSTTAMATQALLLGKKSDLAMKAVSYLSDHHNNSYWYNSFGTAQVMSALVDYSVINNEINPNYSYSVKLGEKTLASGNINSLSAKIPDIKINLSELKSPQKLTVEKTGTGEIYSDLNSELWIEGDTAISKSNDISIIREYINEKGSEYNIVPGDLVKVNLIVNFKNNEAFNYAMIEDHLPAGLIPVNTNLKNESVNEDRNSEDYYKYNIEYTKDGANIPLYLATSKTYTYLARAISAGKFTSSPASVSMMYNPAVFSRTDFGQLTIEGETNLSSQKIFKNLKAINPISVIIILLVVLSLVFVTVKKIIPYVKSKINRDPPVPTDPPTPITPLV